jgi:predicted nucleotidyltransferase
MQDKSAIVETLHRYFVSVESVSFAFLFGSTAQGRQTEDSEIDIESDSIDENEDAIWDEIEKLTGSSVDLVVLNRALATLSAYSFRQGHTDNHQGPQTLPTSLSRSKPDFRRFPGVHKRLLGD